MNDKVGQKLELQLVTDLPADLERAIGRVIYKHSVLEDKLKALAYSLSGLTPAWGRLIMREPRSSEYFEMVLDILRLQEFELKMNKEEIERLLSNLRLAKKRRDLLAHSTILKDPADDELYLVDTKGNWTPDPKNKEDPLFLEPSRKPIRVKRLIEPTCTSISAEIVEKGVTAIILPMIAAIEALGLSLSGLPASRRKSP